LLSPQRKVVFAQGFTDPDHASLYIADIDCELAGTDEKDPEKILQSSFATIVVTMVPTPRPDDDQAPKPKAKAAQTAPADLPDEDDAKSVESKATEEEAPPPKDDGKGKDKAAADKKPDDTKSKKSSSSLRGIYSSLHDNRAYCCLLCSYGKTLTAAVI
jgi:hypothetical protein